MPRIPGVHRQRFESQRRGEGEYLIAWEGDRPVGHLFVEWDGTRREAVRAAMPNCPPNLSDIAVHPEYQGRGYATEAARLLLPYAFQALDQSRVISLIHPDNAPSRRVAEKLGQRIEGETEVLTMPVLIYAASRPS